MIVAITRDGTASLLEPDVFTSFSVRVADGESTTAAAALAAAGAGRALHGEDDVAVAIAWIRDQIRAAGVSDGDAKLDGMLAYARTKGWVDDASESIRAHVEE